MTRGNILLTGDLNSDLLKRDRNGNKLLQILHDFNYKNLIKVPTRVTEMSSTLLDLVFVSNPSKVYSSSVIDIAIADHKFIFAVYMLKQQRAKPKIVYTQSFRKVNVKQLKHDFEHAPWWICSSFDNLDDITWSWQQMYMKTL